MRQMHHQRVSCFEANLSKNSIYIAFDLYRTKLRIQHLRSFYQYLRIIWLTLLPRLVFRRDERDKIVGTIIFASPVLLGTKEPAAKLRWRAELSDFAG